MSESQGSIEVAILEGQTVLATPRVAGAQPGVPATAVLAGPHGIIRFDE